MSKYQIGIDTSLTKFAIVVLDMKGNIVNNTLVRCSSSEKVAKTAGIPLVSSIDEGIYYVVHTAVSFLRPYFSDIESISIEGLSLGSNGNVTRNLAGVFHSFMFFMKLSGFDMSKIHIYPPTVLKKHSKKLLDKPKAYKGKDITISAAKTRYSGFLSDFVKSSSSKRAGLDDYSDALMLVYTYNSIQEENK